MGNEQTPTRSERPGAWIGKSLRIKGMILSTEDLTIDGDMEGTIGVGEHALTIGRGASVVADLTAKVITISGSVTGNVRAFERLELRPGGSVVGDLVTPRLLMADGARIAGNVTCAAQPSLRLASRRLP
jgi:cytoskeletal protein CcmA (bactofilin family)